VTLMSAQGFDGMRSQTEMSPSLPSECRPAEHGSTGAALALVLPFAGRACLDELLVDAAILAAAARRDSVCNTQLLAPVQGGREHDRDDTTRCPNW